MRLGDFGKMDSGLRGCVKSATKAFVDQASVILPSKAIAKNILAISRRFQKVAYLAIA